jgi:hypothetical protein
LSLRQFRAFARRLQESIGIFGEIRDILATRSSSMKLKPPDVPTPEMAGGEKANARPAGILSSLALTDSMIDWMLVSLVLRCPGLEGDEHEGAVSGVGLGEKAAAHDRAVILHAVVCLRTASTSLVKASVRCSEAASGS